MNQNRNTFLALVAVVGAIAVAMVMGRTMRSTKPLDVSRNGVHGPYNVHNADGNLMFYNFRAVQPDVLYRGSGFPKDKWIDSEKKVVAAAFADGRTFDFFRSKKIRKIIKLQAESDFKTPSDFYAEAGYFDYWSNKTGYRITVTPLPIRIGHAYDLDASSLSKYPLKEQRTGLRAAADFLDIMKAHRPQDGAVYVHCDAGKDRTGVAVAAYELWRNRGRMNKDVLWRQVRDRYLVSSTIISRDKTASKFAGDKSACKDGSQGFVCGEWLDKLRPQLETIAQL